jgi:pre-mRNA-splicing helicase BRR2
MARPTYNAVLQYAKAKPAIVFAPTRRHAQSIATDFMMYTSGDGAPSRFLKVPTDVLEPFVEKLTDTAAASCAKVGIGLLHESMSESDKATINHLFQQNAIQVCLSDLPHPCTHACRSAARSWCCYAGTTV